MKEHKNSKKKIGNSKKGGAMGIIEEFKLFATKGSAVDLAVGLIIGVTFGKIVSSLVNDVLMPPLGLVLGKIDFSNFFIDLSGKGYVTLAAAREAGAPVIAYGNFINVLIEFVIIAFVVFLLVKQINRLKRKEEAKLTHTPNELALLTQIRDLLKKKRT